MKSVVNRILFVLCTCAAIPLSQAEDQNKLQKECYRQNKGRSCVRLGTTLWREPSKREEARNAFAKGCELKVESACTLKEMGVNTSDQKKAENPPEIQKTGPHSYKVPHETIVKYASHVDDTLSTAEMVSEKSPKGEALGFRFKSIDKGSVFEQLGFLEGDVVTQVNDTKVLTRDAAFSLLPALLYGATEHYRVLLLRKGQVLAQEFDIVQ